MAVRCPTPGCRGRPRSPRPAEEARSRRRLPPASGWHRRCSAHRRRPPGARPSAVASRSTRHQHLGRPWREFLHAVGMGSATSAAVAFTTSATDISRGGTVTITASLCTPTSAVAERFCIVGRTRHVLCERHDLGQHNHLPRADRELRVHRHHDRGLLLHVIGRSRPVQVLDASAVVVSDEPTVVAMVDRLLSGSRAARRPPSRSRCRTAGTGGTCTSADPTAPSSTSGRARRSDTSSTSCPGAQSAGALVRRCRRARRPRRGRRR